MLILFRETKQSAKEAADKLKRQGYNVTVEPAGGYRRAGYVIKAWTPKPEEQEAG